MPMQQLRRSPVETHDPPPARLIQQQAARGDAHIPWCDTDGHNEHRLLCSKRAPAITSRPRTGCWARQAAGGRARGWSARN